MGLTVQMLATLRGVLGKAHISVPRLLRFNQAKKSDGSFRCTHCNQLLYH